MLLSINARTLLEDSGNRLLLSTAAVWEMGVKHALGRLRLPNNLPPADFIPEARPRMSTPRVLAQQAWAAVTCTLADCRRLAATAHAWGLHARRPRAKP
ncbi:hypothetical protein [Thiohalocapsa halophila]|uniref:hypothetical protein n=1 Tax=Thiohalocapsa halophila TaxID=69359 RepID=UPI00190854BF|nr:hypothetical protein [Thiohalocapsa halophila]